MRRLLSDTGSPSPSAILRSCPGTHWDSPAPGDGPSEESKNSQVGPDTVPCAGGGGYRALEEDSALLHPLTQLPATGLPTLHRLGPLEFSSVLSVEAFMVIALVRH